MIDANEKIVVGVSGGADSLCLLHVLWSISNKYAITLIAVHLNHCFRGMEAEADAEFVRAFCQSHKIKSYIETFNVPKYIKETGLSPEEAGREIRYKLFEQIRVKENAHKIAVAQNQNDNVETIVMRFIRGTGIEGLKGIESVRDNIIRPILDIQRSSIEEYCIDNQLKPRIDKTNLEPIYQRNKIRLELLPYVKDNFNTNINMAMIRLSEIAKEENDFIEEQTADKLIDIANIKTDKISFEKQKILQCHIAIQKRLIRMSIMKIVGTLNGFEQKHIESVLHLCTKNTGSAVILPQKLKAYISYNNLILTKVIEKQDKKCYYSLIYDKDQIFKEENVLIKTSIKSIEEISLENSNPYRIFIDYSKISNELKLRNRQQGDVFSPIGMKGSKKLKDYFIDEKIPKESRDNIYLVADDKQIVWIIGNRISERYKISSTTKEVLEICFSNLY